MDQSLIYQQRSCIVWCFLSTLMPVSWIKWLSGFACGLYYGCLSSQWWYIVTSDWCVSTKSNQNRKKFSFFCLKLWSSNYSFTHPVSLNLFLHSFMYLLIHSLIHPSIHPLMHLFIHSLIHPSINAFVHSFTHSFTHSFIHSLIHWFIDSLIHWFIYAFINPFNHYSFIH